MVIPTPDDNASGVRRSRAFASVYTLAPQLNGRVTAIRLQAGAHAATGASLVHEYDAERADGDAADPRVGLARGQFVKARAVATCEAQPSKAPDPRKAELDEAEAAIRQFGSAWPQ